MISRYFLHVCVVTSCVSVAAMQCDYERSIKTFSRIVPITTYAEVKEIFNNAPTSFLFTFDADDTLITAHDVFARTPEPPMWFKLRLFLKNPEYFCDTMLREKIINTFLGVFFSQIPRFVFDPDIVQLIRQLQQRRCPAICLTGMGSGAGGYIKNLPEWRVQLLDGLGFDFSGTFGNRVFRNLPMKDGTFPCLYKGILCANYMEKGMVLGAFLDHYFPTPRQITCVISFDDQKNALESIARACKQRHINFIGYQMLGAKKLPGTWRTSRALIQFEYAVKYGRWLSDQDADDVAAVDIFECCGCC